MDCLFGHRPDQNSGTKKKAMVEGVGGECSEVSNRQVTQVTISIREVWQSSEGCRKAEPGIRKTHQQTMESNFQKGYKCSGHNWSCRIPGPFTVRDQTDLMTLMLTLLSLMCFCIWPITPHCWERFSTSKPAPGRERRQWVIKSFPHHLSWGSIWVSLLITIFRESPWIRTRETHH